MDRIGQLRHILEQVPAGEANKQDRAHASILLDAAEHAAAEELRPVLHALAAGRVVVVDDSMGEGTAVAALRDARRLLATGVLHAEIPSGRFFPGLPPGFAHVVYKAAPGCYDMFRLVTTLPEGGHAPALEAISERMWGLADALGRAESQLGVPMSPAWPAAGVARDMQGSLLAVSGFNGTRYALHSDARADHRRKLTLTFFPRTDVPLDESDGGALRIWEASGQVISVGPRAGRLVIFNAELPHEVIPACCTRPDTYTGCCLCCCLWLIVPFLREVEPAQRTRLSLTMWALGVGERRMDPAASEPVERPHHCTSTMCRQRLAGLRDTAQRDEALRLSRLLCAA